MDSETGVRRRVREAEKELEGIKNVMKTLFLSQKSYLSRPSSAILSTFISSCLAYLPPSLQFCQKFLRLLLFSHHFLVCIRWIVPQRHHGCAASLFSFILCLCWSCKILLLLCGSSQKMTNCVPQETQEGHRGGRGTKTSRPESRLRSEEKAVLVFLFIDEIYCRGFLHRDHNVPSTLNNELAATDPFKHRDGCLQIQIREFSWKSVKTALILMQKSLKANK